MLAASKATAPPRNLPNITPRTKAPFCSAPKRHKLCLLIVLSELKPQKDRARTIRRVDTIAIIAIAALAALGLRAPSQPLGSTPPRPRLKMIVVVTSQRVGKIGTWAKSLVTTVIRKAILPTNALSSASQKTSIGLGDLLVGDWC